jgi:S1-C subfamily serine protease
VTAPRFHGKSEEGAARYSGRPVPSRASVVAVSLVSAVLGAALVLAIGGAAGVVGAREEPRAVLAPAATEQPSRREATPAARPVDGQAFDPGRIYAERLDGVVTVYALFSGGDSPAAGGGQGSGFVVSADGHILTNAHVVTTAGEGSQGSAVRGADDVFVEFSDGDRVSARTIGWDVFDDVAVIKVDPSDHELHPLPLGDSDEVRVGDPVAAIGSPFGEEGTLTVGVVSATRRSIAALTSNYTLVDAIQTDAPINRGNSGGPLFDARGFVVGINAQIRSTTGLAEGVGFAVPINSAKRSLEELVATGRVAYAFVGITTNDMTPALARRLGYRAERGALVVGVSEGPARAAGMRGSSRRVAFQGREVETGGDLVVAIDGREVASADDLVRIVTHELRPGQRSTFTVVRGARTLELEVELGERPADAPAR